MNGAFLLVVFGLLCCDVNTFPAGPPVGTKPDLCTSMTPNHGAQAQTRPAPFGFKLLAKGECYTPGQPLNVSFRSEKAGELFHGLFVQVRRRNFQVAAETIRSFGSFSVDASEKHMAPLNCFGRQNSAVGHKNAQKADLSSVFFSWTPDGTEPSIILIATVVQTKKMFWMEVTKDVPRCSNPPGKTGNPPIKTGNTPVKTGNLPVKTGNPPVA